MTLIRLTKLCFLLFPLCGCIPKPLVKPVLLPVYDPPSLTPIPAGDVQCLSNKTYTDIVNREGKLRHWGQQEFNVIHVNNEQAKKEKKGAK